MKKLSKVYQFEWPGVHLHQLLPPARAWIKDFADLGSPFNFLAITYVSGVGSIWILDEEYKRQGYIFYKKVKKNPQILFKILDSVDEAADDIFEVGKIWNYADLSMLTTKLLFTIHKALFEPAEILWRRGQPQNLLEMRNNFLSSEAQSIIKARFGQKRQAYVFTALTTGFYDSLIERQDRDFLNLLSKTKLIATERLNANPAVIMHWKKYAYMTYGWEGPDFSIDYFVSNILEARKNKKILTGLKYKIAARNELRKKAKMYLKLFSSQERALVVLLRRLLDSKAKRIDAHSQTYFLGDKLFAELGKRRGFSVSQLRTIDPTIFKKRYLTVNADQLNADYKKTVLWWERGKTQKKYNGEKAENLINKLNSALPKVKKVSVLHGELAYPGKVRGKARIVFYAQGVKDFKEGEILITKMTDPSFVPIMRKASAVVTDIGGITCHAAIVARELRKPCLIGTEIATKIFKDGDLVEVDAFKGIVKKLKK